MKLTKQQIEAINDEIDHVYHNMLIEDDEESRDIDDDLPALEHVISLAQSLIGYCNNVIKENTLVHGMRIFIPSTGEWGNVVEPGSEDSTVKVDRILEPQIYLNNQLQCIGRTKLIEMVYTLNSTDETERRIHTEVIKFLAKEEE